MAAGFITSNFSPLGGSDFAVLKFDGARGAELWRQLINGTANSNDEAVRSRWMVRAMSSPQALPRTSAPARTSLWVKLRGTDGGDF